MDEFGVLTEQYGLKPQGKSAPMAASKRSTSTNGTQAWSSNKGKSGGWGLGCWIRLGGGCRLGWGQLVVMGMGGA
ncbi:unnamed protein product [Prunus armeniaca]|uniref:Uncharacterized protein n=1 Tax=Prunus armeniaca TaxID=36596 RepID=A0A6J5V6J5_PRUAR|nr:unnamed protein product [Prunus armeniaca]